MRKVRSQQQWQQIHDDQQQSGLTIAAYCREHNISTNGFYAHRDKHNKVSAKQPVFVSTTVTKQTLTKEHQALYKPIVLECSSATLKLPATTPAEYLITLLNGLSS